MTAIRDIRSLSRYVILCLCLLLVACIYGACTAPAANPGGVQALEQSAATEPPVEQAVMLDEPVYYFPDNGGVDMALATGAYAEFLQNGDWQDSMGIALAQRLPPELLNTGGVSFDWSAVTGVLTPSVEGGGYDAVVVAAPIMDVNQQYISSELFNEISAGNLPMEDLILGTVSVGGSDVPGFAQGNYFLEWNPAQDQIYLIDSAGGAVAVGACEDSSPVEFVEVTFEPGSIGICASFDSRKCCI